MREPFEYLKKKNILKFCILYHSHGSSSVFLPNQLGYNYKVPEDVLSPPTYDYGPSTRSLRYGTEPGRVRDGRIR